MNRSFSHTLLVICLVVLGITGCDIIEKLKGDSKSSVPPVLPDLQLVQPNIDFFTTEFTELTLEDTSGYELASLLVKTEFNPFVQGIYTYLPFVQGSNQGEPASSDNGWEWNYSHTQEGQHYNIRLTAQEMEDTREYYKWILFISTTQNQEESLDNFKLMELSTRRDRSGGFWIIYPPELQDPNADFPPYLSLTWEKYNPNNEEYYYEFYPYSPDSNEEIQAGYIIDDNSNFEFNRQINMFIENAEFEAKIFNIAWNNNTSVGLLNLEGNLGGEVFLTVCWDESFNDTECRF